MAVDCTLHVVHAAIDHLDGISVEDFMKFI